MNRIRVVLAYSAILAVACLATFRAVSADTVDLKSRELEYWRAWQQGPETAAPLYAKDAGLVFYDIEPLKYNGWDEYKAGVGPNVLTKVDHIAFTVNDDVKTSARGNVAWTTATVKGDGALKDGAPLHVVIRHTAIWEKRGGAWLIVHEHVSIPSSLPAPPAR